MIERAAKILGVKPKNLNVFEDLDDPYNRHKLTGVICRESDHRYGALVLFKVNNTKCEQVIYGTPKLEYPFDKAGNYHWPEIKQVEIWEKLDGTNILAYHYKHLGKDCISYKTRLTPILKDSGFGSFRSMWDEYRQTNRWVEKVIKANPNYNLSFELWGARNPITVKYRELLKVSLLFGVRYIDHAIRPPSQLNLPEKTQLPKNYQCPDMTCMTKIYNSFRDNMQTQLDRAGEMILEGMVFYAHIGKSSWKMWKCKPSDIEQLHWAASGHISWASLWTTAINLFEDSNSPSIRDYIRLLEEEYPIQLIYKNTKRIEKILNMAKDHMTFSKRVNDVWELARKQGLDVETDKNKFFRFMSGYFNKSEMRRVGYIVLGG